MRARKRFPYTDSLWLRPATEADWLALRRDDITATDAAALFGVSPYRTIFELYHLKAGTLTVDFEESDRMRWGKRLQGSIAAGICDDNGWQIIGHHPFQYVRSKRFVGLGASPDYIVSCPKRGVGLLEIKNVDTFVAKDEWETDEAPVHIELQLQQQLECAQLPWGAIGGLIGGNTARVIIRERDPEVGAEIGTRAVELWRRVRDADPPGADYRADYDTIKSLYRDAIVGKVEDYTQPDPDLDAERGERLKALAERAHALDRVKKAAEADADAAKAELLEAIGDTERAVFNGIKLSAVTVHLAESTQIRKASTYRKLTITPVKPPKN